MPKVNIKQNSNLNPQEAYDKVTSFLSDDSDLKKLDPSYTCDFDPKSLSGKATGKLFKANMKITEDGDGSTVEIIVDLPLHLALAKSMVEKTLTKKLGNVIS